MVTSTMDSVDEEIPNFKELSSKTEPVYLSPDGKENEFSQSETRQGYSELPVCHLSQQLNV